MTLLEVTFKHHLLRFCSEEESAATEGRDESREDDEVDPNVHRNKTTDSFPHRTHFGFMFKVVLLFVLVDDPLLDGYNLSHGESNKKPFVGLRMGMVELSDNFN